MTRYIHRKEWDAHFLEALVSERMKELITKNCPKMQIGGMKGNSSSEHPIVIKTWMKTNEEGEITCIFIVQGVCSSPVRWLSKIVEQNVNTHIGFFEYKLIEQRKD